MQLSIIIVSYNVRALLAQCIASIEAAGKGLEYEIIVVDNNSKDDSFPYFTKKETGVKFIWNKENLGFAKANNLGLLVARGDYILFLNPDTVLTQDSLRQCLDHLTTTPNCGALGVHMIDGVGNYLSESKRFVPGLLASVFYFSGISKLVKNSKFFNAYHAGNIDKNQRSEVPILSGAFMMASVGIMKEAGGFDPRYFMYAEDVDLSMSIEKLGYKNWYLVDVKIVHYKGESSIIKDDTYYQRFFSAMKIFVKKYNGKIAAFLKSLLIDMTHLIFKVKNQLAVKSSEADVFKVHHNVAVFCSSEERELIRLLNQKYGFAKNIIFIEGAATIPGETTAVIYSTTSVSFTNIIDKISNSHSDIASYIFNDSTKTLIGSNGKLAAAIVFTL